MSGLPPIEMALPAPFQGRIPSIDGTIPTGSPGANKSARFSRSCNQRSEWRGTALLAHQVVHGQAHRPYTRLDARLRLRREAIGMQRWQFCGNRCGERHCVVRRRGSRRRRSVWDWRVRSSLWAARGNASRQHSPMLHGSTRPATASLSLTTSPDPTVVEVNAADLASYDHG